MHASITIWLIKLLATIMIIGGSIQSENMVHKNLNMQDPELIRIMTFNIRFDNPDDGRDAWEHRKQLVATTMRFHRSDIVGIQEGLIHQLKDLDKSLSYFERIGVGRTAGDDRGEFSAIFYRKDRFELLEHETFWLSEKPSEPGSVGWDAMLPRIVTWGHFSDKSTDYSFYVFNTHFDHQGEEARVKSARLILDKIAQIAGNEPIALIGDFNVTEDQKPYKTLTGAKNDNSGADLSDGFYHAEYGHHGPTSTWNGFEEIVPGRRIDYIFTNNGFQVVQHAILADHNDGRFPSDHLPVIADLRFSE